MKIRSLNLKRFLLSCLLMTSTVLAMSHNLLTDSIKPDGTRYNAAYEMEKAKLEETLRNRQIGTGVAKYEGGNVTTPKNGYFTYPKETINGVASGEWYYGQDLQSCIEAMIQHTDGGTIEFKNSYRFYSGDSTAQNGGVGQRYVIDGYGKVMLKAVQSTSTKGMNWGLLNIARNKDWSDPEHYKNLPADVVELNNITIDGGTEWTGTNDSIIGRGPTPHQTYTGDPHSWPLIWFSNMRGTLIINEGTILQNFNSSSSNTKGGALNFRRGKCYMYGGAILDCSVSASSNDASGGGIFVCNAEKVKVSDTETYSVPAAEFYMYGGTIAGCYASATTTNFGGGAMYIGGIARLMGGNIGFMGSDANGNPMRRGNKAVQGGGIVVVAGADCEIGGPMMISYNGSDPNKSGSSKGGGLYVEGKSGTTTVLRINGGEISNNSCYSQGGGIFIAQYADANINGCYIINNHTYTYNNSNAEGAGIYVNGNNIITIDGESAIVNNTADKNGGGIYSASGSTINLFDCTIAYNKCGLINNGTDYNGAGIYNKYTTTDKVGNIKLKGSPKVHDNVVVSENDKLSNILVTSIADKVTVIGNLSNNTNVGFRCDIAHNDDCIVEGSATHTLTGNDILNLSSDDPTRGLIYVDNTGSGGYGQAKFATPKTITFDMVFDGLTAPSSISSVAGRVVELPEPNNVTYSDGTHTYIFVGWSNDNTSTIGNMQWTMPAANLTLYAIWADIAQSINVYLDANYQTKTSETIGTISNPANSFSTAKAILLNGIDNAGATATGRIIIINNPVAISNDIDLSLRGNNLSVVRYGGDVPGYAPYKGEMFVLTGSRRKVNLHDIVIDGGFSRATSVEANGTIFNLGNTGSKLTLNSGTILKNNHNVYLQSAAESSGYGGAIYVRSSDTIVINGGFIQSCYANSGGAIYSYNGTVIMNNGIIGGDENSGNKARDYGSAITAVAASTLHINGGNISYNSDIANALNGTIYIKDNCDASINNVLISHNSAKYGGAVSATNTSLLISGGTLYYNSATTNGGCLFIQNSCEADLEGGIISDNTASRGGGIYVCSGGRLNMRDGQSGFGQIIQNTAISAGGGVYLEPATGMTANGKLFVNGSVVILTNKVNDIDNNVYLPVSEGHGLTIVYNGHLKGYVGISTQEIPTLEHEVKVGISHNGTLFMLNELDAENIYSDNEEYFPYLDPHTGSVYLRLNTNQIHNNKIVYLDGVNGDDDNNSGLVSNNAVKTFFKAKTLLRNKMENNEQGIIYIVNTVTVKSGETWSLENKENAVVKRFPGDENHLAACTGTCISVESETLNGTTTNGYLILSKITIDGNNVSAASPLIEVKDEGTISAFTGTIFENANNTSVDKFGGAININAGGQVNMYEGSIIRNCQALNGGAVYLENPEVDKKATLLLGEKSEISGNKANKSGNNDETGLGGGVYAGHGRIELLGSTIIDNTASVGGGIYIMPNVTVEGVTIPTGEITVSQNPYINENFNTLNESDNIFMNNRHDPSLNTHDSVTIWQTNMLTEGAHIGIRLGHYHNDRPNGVAQSIDYNSNKIPQSDMKYYSSDIPRYNVSVHEDGKIYLGFKEKWIDVVKAKPFEGWELSTTELKITFAGKLRTIITNNYHISTPQALAWLISVVNGLNGQPGQDLATVGYANKDDTVTINRIYIDNDIDISEYLWTPIGTREKPYGGNFFGNGRVISGCAVYEEDMDNVGFFGYCGARVMINNLGLTDNYIKGKDNVGGIAGNVEKRVTVGNSASDFSIYNTYFHGIVIGNDKVGGLVGYNKGTLKNNYCVQRITATAENASKGYVAGYHAGADTIIKLCYGLEETGLNATGTGSNPLTGENLPTTFTGPSSGLASSVKITYKLQGSTEYSTFETNRLSAALNLAVTETAEASSQSPFMMGFYKWKKTGMTEYPVHAVISRSYWTNVVTSQADAGVGFSRNDDKKIIHIGSAEGLAWLISIVNGLNGQEANNLKDYYIYLDADIDMSAYEFTPIGTSDHYFEGIFAADGHEVNGLFVCDFEGINENAGIFGVTGPNAVIRNLSIEKDCYMASLAQNIGGIVGQNRGNIYNCNFNSVLAGLHRLGGIVGINKGGTILNCFSKASFDSTPVKDTEDNDNYFGGIVGINDSLSVVDGYFPGNIKNCYSLLETNTPLGNEYSGLIAGLNRDSNIEYVYYQKRDGSDTTGVGLNEGAYTYKRPRIFTDNNTLLSNTTIVTNTNSMLTALNEYVNTYQNGVMSTWAIDENVNESYPHFNYDSPFVYVIPDDKWKDIVNTQYVIDSTLTFAGGNGTKQSPYLIDTEERLALLAGLVNGKITNYGGTAITPVSEDSTDAQAAHARFYQKHYKITEDLNLGAHEWSSIGWYVNNDSLSYTESFENVTVNDPFSTSGTAVDFTREATGAMPTPDNGVYCLKASGVLDGNGQPTELSTCEYHFSIPSSAEQNTIAVTFRSYYNNINVSGFKCVITDEGPNPIAINEYIIPIVADSINAWRYNTLNHTTFEAGHSYHIKWYCTPANVNAHCAIDMLSLSYIDLAEHDFTFSGNMDGDGHFVEGIYINASANNYQGLFGYLKTKTVGTNTYTPIIKNTGVSTSYIKYISGSNYVGGIAGMNNGGRIYGCYNSGYIKGTDYIGGIAGYNKSTGQIYNCYNYGAIFGDRNVGGISGYNAANSLIANSFNRGPINASEEYGGGVLGFNAASGTFKNVYSTGLMTGNDIGGVIGMNEAGAVARDCYWENGSATNGISNGTISGNGIDFTGSASAWIFTNTKAASFTIDGQEITTHDLVVALNTGVQLSNASDDKTNFKMWLTDENINDGYPFFADVSNYTANVLWYAMYKDASLNSDATNYTVGNSADLAGLAGLTNHYVSGDDNLFCYYDADGVVRGYGKKMKDFRNYDSIYCHNFSGKYITLNGDVNVNDGYFMEDGTYVNGSAQVLTPAEWEIIGTEAVPFAGSFDADRYIISGLYVSTDTTQNKYAGMFGVVEGLIKNVGLEDSYMETSGENAVIGGIVGKLTNTSTTKMQDCYYTGYVKNSGTGNSLAGGIAGWLTSGSRLYNSYNWAEVSTSTAESSAYSGGIVGKNEGKILNTYSSGVISAYKLGDIHNNGGIVGKNSSTGVVEKSYYLIASAKDYSGLNENTSLNYENNDCRTFSGTGGNCSLKTENSFKYKTLILALNSWCSSQTERFDNWFDSETYPIFMSSTIFWPDIVISRPATGFDIVGTDISISSNEGFAWLISVVNGLNGQDASDLSGHTVTMNSDVDMLKYQWVPIGTEQHPFKGTFRNRHHVIKNVYCNTARTDEEILLVGMFGCIEDAVLDGIVETNTTFSFDETQVVNIGGIAAVAKGTSKIVACRALSTSYSTNIDSWCGGIVAKLEDFSKIVSSSSRCLGTGYNLGGIAGKTDADTKILNSYTRTLSYDINETTSLSYQGGFVGINAGTVENCYYLRDRIQNGGPGNSIKGFFVGKNEVTGKFRYCYANIKGGDDGNDQPYVFPTTNLGNMNLGEISAHGYYFEKDNPFNLGTPEQQIEQYVYLADPDMTSPYISSSELTTLKEALNNWQADENNSDIDCYQWIQCSDNINDNYPILKYPDCDAVGIKGGGTAMLYYTTVVDAITEYNANESGGFLALINPADISQKPITNNSNVGIYILDYVSLMHNSEIKASTKLHFDNSKGPRDWHLASTCFSTVDGHNNIGIIHDSTFATGYGKPVNPSLDEASFIPCQGENISNWDFYSYYEPDYHWINFKRNSDNHWHEDGNHEQIKYTNETNLIVGKGYLLSFSEEKTISGSGTLNNGDITIPVTASGKHCKGYNLLGNPYQSYIDFNIFCDVNLSRWNTNHPAYYVYDADKNGFITYARGAYDGNPETASQYISMHQGFFIIADQEGEITFNNDMRTIKTGNYSHFRGEEPEPIQYPIINVVMSDDENSTERVAIELNHPDDGGALRLTKVKEAKGSVYTRCDNQDYWIKFFPEETNKVPVWFEAHQDGEFRLDVSYLNAEFSYLHLIDNITGADVDMLADSTYTFTGRTDDYSARFRLVFRFEDEPTQPGDDDDDDNNSSDNFAYFDNGDLVVDGSGILQVIDIQGRILHQAHVEGNYCRVSLPSMPHSVYILRLVGEREVKTQKIVW